MSASVSIWFSPGTPVSSTNKTYHDITEILLKVVLNTIQSVSITITDFIHIFIYSLRRLIHEHFIVIYTIHISVYNIVILNNTKKKNHLHNMYKGYGYG